MTTFTLSTAARNAACNAIVDLCDVGAATESSVVIATAGSATDLVTIGLGGTAFGNAATGVATATTLPVSGTATATGTAARFRLTDQATPTAAEIAHGDVGTSLASMIITNTSINSSDVVQLTAMTVTVPAT